MSDPIQEKISVYRPNRKHDLGYLRAWAVMIQTITQSRELIWQLFKRDFFASYKKSFIGVAWVVLTPLISIVVWILLKHSGVLRPGDVGVPYPVYVLIGSSVWGLFMGFYTSAANTLTDGQQLVLQVHYPHEVFLFVKSLLQVLNFIIGFTLNILVLLCFGILPGAAALLFPAVVLPLFFLGAGFGLLVSMISVVAFDLEKAIATLMGLLIWSVPVIYSPNVTNPLLQAVIRWNPLTYLVCSARDIILHGKLYHPAAYFASAGLSFLVFFASWRLFYVSEGELVERIHT